MTWLNYHHLLYFWKVAKEGSIARASAELRLAPPTISVQIHQLEEMLGQKLFSREGRGLALTEAGRVAFRYADSIFATGDALVQALTAGGAQRPIRVVVGLSGALPKSLVRQFLEPVFSIEPGVCVSCSNDRTSEAFLTDLATGSLDVVLTDEVAPATPSLRIFSHPLGDCGTVFLASSALANKLKPGFPGSLDGAPFIFPRPNSVVRRVMDEWFYAHGILPKILAEMDDAALAVVLAETGLGVIAVPEVIAVEVARDHRLQTVGRAPHVRQNFFAWSLEQKIRHPAVVGLCDAARNGLRN